MSGRTPLLWARSEIQEDTKISHAATFRINKQDHTMANMIRSVSEDPAFSSQATKSPTCWNLASSSESKLMAAYPPLKLQEACRQVIAIITDLQQKFNKEFEMKEIDEVGARLGVGLGPYGETLGSRGIGISVAHGQAEEYSLPHLL
ncbi:uncharacterized protein EI90DRAFT_3157824 [Cantharellus anzutake]|uniref:uncharacterized protein n=1 Tax=Cantharellus anzutake TaxID=1750568 RepID=UPI001903FF96|nr:uncharacterized protein EI90DRAFT_3157824 [Cantharellus anzutake]KAF8321919.1 hypothetical protein EI90DRAFT_3157824 [Cantharellus anzutake]